MAPSRGNSVVKPGTSTSTRPKRTNHAISDSESESDAFDSVDERGHPKKMQKKSRTSIPAEPEDDDSAMDVSVMDVEAEVDNLFDTDELKILTSLTF